MGFVFTPTEEKQSTISRLDEQSFALYLREWRALNQRMTEAEIMLISAKRQTYLAEVSV